MTTTTIRQKLTEYIHFADDKKIKAIYTMVEREIEEKDIWTEEFTQEMLLRSKEFETGKVNGIESDKVFKKILLKIKKQK